jgi:uncharacterized membrane protein SpoIIM required for sporulation
MARPWFFVWGPIAWQAVIAATLLFFGGLLLGMAVERRDITWAAAYGRWVLSRLETWLTRRNRGFGMLTVLITTVNATAALVIIVAAHFPPLSLFLIVVAGLNTGVMAQRTAGAKSWIALLMPHAWLELPAVITASAAAIQASVATLGLQWFDVMADTIWAKAFFLRVTLPLLVGAAIIEAALMIHLGEKR